MQHLDRRRKYYLILDCETATMPHAMQYTGEERKKVCIAKPLIYDIGWTIIDRTGKVYKKIDYVVNETFFNMAVFNTAYYADKRPFYMERIKSNDLICENWHEIIAELMEDMGQCEAVGAYNAMFDFKKAIPFTETYIRHVYDEDFYEWEKMVNAIIDDIASGKRHESERTFDPNNFILRGNIYPMFDLWGLACKYLLNTNEYKAAAKDNNWITASGKHYSTTAENCYKFVSNNNDFKEAHTALADALIESEIFSKIVGGKSGLKNFEIGIIYFPFRLLGKCDNDI